MPEAMGNGFETMALQENEASSSESTSLLGLAADAQAPSTEATTATSEDDLSYARRLLYLSHFFAQFSEQVWQFSLILFLAAFEDFESLRLVSSYGLVSGLVVCLFGGAVGCYVDRSNRLQVAQSFLWTENVSVILATACCYLLLQARTASHHDSLLPQTLVVRRILLVGIHVFGPLAQILDRGFLVAMERDWVVVLSEASNNQNEWLSDTNVILKQMDLGCRVVAPAVAGWVMGAFGGNKNERGDLTGAASLVGVVNGAALLVEYVCTARIYVLVPSLATKTRVSEEQTAQTKEENGNDEDSSKKCTSFLQLPRGLQVYLEQPVAWAGLGLALLYLNALTFGALMTAYLVWRGMRLETVGIWRGISSAVGLAGTFAFHGSVQRTTLMNTGMWSIVYEFVCLSLAFFALFVDDYYLSMSLLILGVCGSRLGLWVFDITVTQLMQEFIPPGVRGLVGGTQQSLNAFFLLLSFALGLVFPNPKEFHIYATAGYTAVGLAVILYTFGVYFRRDKFLTDSERDASLRAQEARLLTKAGDQPGPGSKRKRRRTSRRRYFAQRRF